MRQTGRYLPEYRQLRTRYTLRELWSDPELACQVTLFPLKRFDVDALIVFADLMSPVEELGIPFEISDGIGPVAERPIRSPSDVEAFPRSDGRGLGLKVARTIQLVKAEVFDIPVIGFCGGPFTVVSYLVEGGPSRDFAVTRSFLYSDPSSWHLLMEKVTDALIGYLKDLVLEGGADVVQVFDSWVGVLSPDDYKELVFPHTKRLFEETVFQGVPRIHFGTGTGSLLRLMREVGGEVISVDWRVPLDTAWEQIGWDRAIQGNLEPAALFGSREALTERALTVLRRAGERPGHIFNLGHGVLPGTDPDQVAFLVDLVHTASERSPSHADTSLFKAG